jgi:glycosyltransferase involved in cell wall biosynthesis
MKIVFLCKRRPMGRDLIERPYGRFFHLPRLLAARGHEVHLALLSYANDSSVDFRRDGMHWLSESIFVGPRYLMSVRRLVRDVRPDWIVGLSDTYYGILAERLGRRHRTSSLIDAYDNYEGYLPWCKPLHGLWRTALRRATALSVAGPALTETMGNRADATHVATMAPDPFGFRPLPMDDCRRELGLPTDAKLVGYCGAICPSRGIRTLFEAIEVLKASVPDVRLVLSGRRNKRVSVPSDAVWLGYISDEKVPVLLNSMNAVAVVNKPSAFGKYSHPIKLYEAMSCHVPVVASRTPATEWILARHSERLAAPGDAADLARKLEAALYGGRVDYGTVSTWEDVAASLEGFLASRRETPRGR